MSLEWSQEEEELLVDFYARHESLHNKHHADYNYNRKNKLLTELVRNLNKITPSKRFKVDSVSTHWNELRNTYNQHKRQVMKTELVGRKSTQFEPAWIWWRKMNDIFAGPTFATTADQSFAAVPVLSPPRKRGYSSKTRDSSLHTTEIKEAEDAETPISKYTPPFKVSRRRTIHPLASTNFVGSASQSGSEDTEFECEIKIVPTARKTLSKRSTMLVNSISAEAVSGESQIRNRKASVPKRSVADTQDLSRKSLRSTVDRLHQQSVPPTEVVPMDTDALESSSQSAIDECATTAMFVESRLRTYDSVKRQRIIFKIHELLYQEEIR